MKANVLLTLPALIALSALTVFSGAALAADADLLRCRALGDSAARLACYDALPVGNADVKAAAMAPAPVTKPEQDFGRISMPKAKAETVEALQSTIVGTIGEWRRGQQIKLANGQVWQVNDEPANFKPLSNPAVTIKPGMLGSYFMDIAGVGFQVKVKRVQ